MRTSVFILMLSGFVGMLATGCNNSKQYRPDAKIVSAMNARYPKATKVEWKQKHGYQVAEYHDGGVESKAWFDNNGKWLMTENDLKYGALPAAVRNSFERSIYAGWKKDDVDKIERDGMPAVYIIEAEKGGEDTDLYFTADGKLVKVINDAGRDRIRDYMPLMPVILNQVRQKYPDAAIIETDDRHGKLYVDIADNGRPKELVFDNNRWVSTSWKVDKADVPSVVMTALRGSEYNNYEVKDIVFRESGENSCYRFYLEQGNDDKEVDIDAAGQIVK